MQRSGFVPTLEPPALEAEYRERAFGHDIRMARLVSVWVVVAFLVTVAEDVLLLPPGLSRTVPIGLRFFLAALSAGFAAHWWLRSSWVTFDREMLAWTLIVAPGVLVLDATRPPSFSYHSVIDLLLVLSVYTLAPLNLRRQMIVGMGYSLVALALLYFREEPSHDAARLTITSAHVVGNAVGVYGSYRFGWMRRDWFQLLRAEEAARQELTVAMDEIRTLRGIISICSGCKRVRRDDGAWERIETYIRDRSLAEFSHGLCATCTEELYPELAGIVDE